MRYFVLVWFATAALLTMNLYAVKAHGLPPVLALGVTFIQCEVAIVILLGVVFGPGVLHGVKTWWLGRFRN